MALLSARLKRHSWLYSLGLALRLTPVGRHLRQRAAALGFRLRYRRDAVCVSREGREVWFPLDQVAHVWTILGVYPEFERRLIFEPGPRGGRADLRRAQWYRIPGTADRVRLPCLPELPDLWKGYAGRGVPAEGAVVFDGGAYCGELSICLARTVGPRGRVFAFEPDPTSADLLEGNVKAAGLDNVTLVRRGLWSHSAQLSFAAQGAPGSRVGPADGAIQVPVISLSEAAEQAGAVPAFVKLDIEGAEVEVIEGSLDFIARHSIRFAIASYHLRDGRPTSERLEVLFRKIGYQVETGYPEHPTTWAWRA